ncbi:MAG TPA: 2-dehydropantoate 2-reductase [Roseiarcus sp.]
MNRRIAVVGTGANGAAIASDLALAGRDVTLIEQWPENVAAIRRRGIVVRLQNQEFTATARVLNLSEVATLRETFDVILIVVKTYDTRWAARLVEPLLAPDGLMVGVQNGMTMEAIAETVGAHRTMGCVIENGGAMYDPGVVLRDTPHAKAWFAVGPYDRQTEGREAEVVEVLRHSGRVEVYADIRAAKWMKLIVNAAEVAPSAILDRSLAAAIETPGMRELMLKVGCEAIEVAKKASIPVVPMFGLPDLDPENPKAFIETLLDTIIYSYAQPNSKVAALQDWMKGRRSEIDDMNGAVVRKGAEVGVETPYNRHVLNIALRIESGALDAGRGNLAPLLAIMDA